MRQIFTFFTLMLIGIITNAQIVEDFQGGSVPSGWTVYSPTYDTTAGNTWMWHIASYTGDYFMRASAYASSTNYATEQWLITPVFSTVGATNVQLMFQNDQGNYPGNNLQCYISTNYTGNTADLTSSTWTELTGITLSTGNYNVVDNTVDLSAYAGQSNVYIGFKYTSTTSEGAVWDVDSVYVINSTGFNTVSDVVLGLYPNPAKNTIYINSESNNNNVKIVNCVGEVVLKKEHVKNFINVGNLKTGIYLVVIENDKGKIVKKFIKQ